MKLLSFCLQKNCFIFETIYYHFNTVTYILGKRNCKFILQVRVVKTKSKLLVMAPTFYPTQHLEAEAAGVLWELLASMVYIGSCWPLGVTIVRTCLKHKQTNPKKQNVDPGLRQWLFCCFPMCHGVSIMQFVLCRWGALLIVVMPAED